MTTHSARARNLLVQIKDCSGGVACEECLDAIAAALADEGKEAREAIEATRDALLKARSMGSGPRAWIEVEIILDAVLAALQSP